MDLFDEILKQANSNTRNASKEIKKIDEAAHQKTKKCVSERLAAERKETKAMGTAATEKPKFVIPKKKANGEHSVDKSKIELFLKRREEEKRKALIEKKREKEELIKLRLQSYGGKANKKLAKQFGSTPIKLQRKYGNDREHEEYLGKLQIKEEEETNRLNTKWHRSVIKALERKKVVEKTVGSESRKDGSYRVAINKNSSLRRLTKEDSPGPSTSSVSEGKLRKVDKKVAIKRRLPPTESSFSLLMKKAEAIQNGQVHSRGSSPLHSSSLPKQKIPCYEPPERNFRGINFDEHKKKPKSAVSKKAVEQENSKKLAVEQRSSTAADRTSDIQNSHVRRQEVQQVFLSGSSTAPVSRRYLPGDIRYQGLPAERFQKSVKKDGKSSFAGKGNVKEFDKSNKDVRRRTSGKSDGENRAKTDSGRQDPLRRVMSREDAVVRFKAHSSLHLEKRRDLEELHQRRNDDNLDEDIDDEEYDSEMDDFIDDSELDEHLKRGDLEETLRLINPRYDKNRWKSRERMIDDRQMEASYRDIAREEKRSSRIGLIEDIRAAQSGKSFAL